MAHTGGDSFVKDSVITDDDEPMIVGDDRRVMVDNNDQTIIRSKNKVLIPINNESVLVDIFAREASIINQSYPRKFFLSDKCKFDVIKTNKGLEAVNIQITERNIKSISQLPKIPRKKENNEQQMEILKDILKSTMYDLINFLFGLN
ncbi:unnamed protein product [Rotaria sp. Silwood1]|nr:unnamed protein product [Rotaria sp. Silwood1]CAF3887962.1 unnamed protein product [Rotaria sp. Silwood1]